MVEQPAPCWSGGCGSGCRRGRSNSGCGLGGELVVKCWRNDKYSREAQDVGGVGTSGERLGIVNTFQLQEQDVEADDWTSPLNMTGKQVCASANMQIQEVADVFAPHILQLQEQDVEAAGAAPARNQTWLNKATADSQVEGNA